MWLLGPWTKEFFFSEPYTCNLVLQYSYKGELIFILTQSEMYTGSEMQI